MSDAFRELYLADVRAQFASLQKTADAALAQVSDDEFFWTGDPESNSLALIVKHLSGNLRSRWTDFLTSDGEKPDRQRDREFVREPGDTRAGLMDAWQRGWAGAHATLTGLAASDLDRMVSLRGEPLTVLRAMQRQLGHAAYHVGQIVWVAKHLRSTEWRNLSIPRTR
jgi:hypothetical protein